MALTQTGGLPGCMLRYAFRSAPKAVESPFAEGEIGGPTTRMAEEGSTSSLKERLQHVGVKEVAPRLEVSDVDECV